MNRSIFFILLFLITAAALGTYVHGAVFNVTTTDDNVAGSLRAAITTATGNDEDDIIYLPAGTYVLSGALDIDTPHGTTIIGDTPGTTIIDGGGHDRVFHIANGIVSISGVTIQGGKAELEEHGGGIYNNGTLTLTNCTVRNNGAGKGGQWSHSAYTANGGHGGGIYNLGSVTLTDCTIQNNHAGEGMWSDMYQAGSGGHGGGIYNLGFVALTGCTASGNNAGNGGNTSSGGYPAGDGGSGGGIYNGGTINLTNCTVYNNKTGYGEAADGGGDGISGNGGGICNTAGATAALKHCTVTSNTAVWRQLTTDAGYGGGVFNAPSGTVNIENTIISDNIVETGGTGPDCYGTFNSLGYNLIRDVSTCTVSGDTTGNITNSDPLLSALSDNGGPTPTCALNEGSPAIDAGYGNGIGRDQRNYPRPQDFPAIPNASDGADIGAFELKALYTISGNITADGTPLAGVTLTFGDGGDTVVTDKNGDYSYSVAHGWSGTVTPSGEDYGFTPADREYTGITADQTGQDYTADAYTVSIGISSPSDGDTVSGTVTISVSASSSGGRSSVQGIGGVEFYIDDTLVGADPAGPYEYTWDTTPYANGTHTIKVSASNSVGMTGEAEIAVTVENLRYMSLSRSRLNFGADTGGAKTGDQRFMIGCDGAPLTWTVTDDAEWLACTPGSGTGPGVVTVSVDASQMAVGTYTGTITAAAAGAADSPQTVTVYLAVYGAGTTTRPLGNFDTPQYGAIVSGSVPLTGWVVDDIEVEHVKIYRQKIAGESGGLVYIGEAVQVEGARPDIETGYPDFPFNYRAGWGYMLLTNFLPNQGNGVFVLYAEASDKEGNTVTLETTTIVCENDRTVKPFGAIDTPAQGGTVSGGDYINYGWALTPLPNTIPTDGSTIRVWVDGVSLGRPVYNLYREDIAALFPGYNNSDGAVGYFALDTTAYANGVHTISWVVEDDAGNTDGIGSRYFTIQNNSQNRGHQSSVVHRPSSLLSPIPVDYFNPVGVVRGYRKDMDARYMYPDDKGTVTVEIRELERVALRFTPDTKLRALTPLPIGSTFDPKRGIFSWQPGPGFLGRYELVFMEQRGTGEIRKKHIIFNINPKFGKD